MITNITPRIATVYIGRMFLIFLLLVVVLFTDVRQQLGEWWWDTTHTMPELLLLITHDPHLGSRMGDYYFDTGYGQVKYDIKRADRLYRYTLYIDETIPWPWYQRARIAFLHEEYETALRYIQIYQNRVHNSRPQALYLKGLVLGFVNKPDQALVAFEEYFNYDNTSWYIYNNLAWTHFQLGNFIDMDSITTSGLQLYPNNPWLLMNKGLAQYNLGHTTTARLFLEQSHLRAKELNPADWNTTYPGNDPAVAQLGLEEFLAILEANRKLIHKTDIQVNNNYIE